MTRKKKRRRLKKWVVVVIPILIIIIIVIILFAIQNNNINNDKITSKKSNEKYDDKVNILDDGSDLNRVVYRKGFYYEDLPEEIIDKITGVTYPKEFDENYSSINYDDLKYIIVKYYDFKGKEHNNGKMIVNKLVAQDVVEIFYKLYQEKYPIEKMVLVDEYDGDDELSMEDNNTSCFNYRIVENIDRLAWHAFGLAIDINPLYNPYVVDGDIYPSTAKEYANRNIEFEGKIDHDDLAYKIFTEYGWKWGGDFQYSKDYQHFYKEVLDDEIRERKD